MHVRRATEPDRELLLSLWDDWTAGSPPPPWVADARGGTAAGIDESIRLGMAVLAERDGAAVGFAAALPRGEGAVELTELYVRPEARGRGVASTLVRELVAAARAAGADHVFVSTAPDGDARRLYERWGLRAHTVELVGAADEVLRRLRR